MRALSKHPPIFYLIANLAEGGDRGEVVQNIARAVRQRAGPERLTLLFQLRDKGATARALYDAALAWNKLLQPHRAYLLVNERGDIAITAGLLGVHLSRESYAISEARELLPEGLIAYSAHSAGQAQEAARAGADLVTLSPIFASPGKGEPLGAGALQEAAAACGDTPLIALGGIGMGNLPEIAATGAAGVALVRAVFASGDPPGEAAKIAAMVSDRWP